METGNTILSDLAGVERIAPDESMQEFVSTPLHNPWGKRSWTPTIQHERPVHRDICLFAMQHMKNVDIAAKVGVSTVTVGNVLRQEWAVKFMQSISDLREKTFESRLNEEILPCFEKLVEMRKDTAVSAETKRKICEGIIARKYGAFTQPIVSTRLNPESMTDEQIQARLAEIKQN